jgi:hypothetical protein
MEFGQDAVCFGDMPFAIGVLIDLIGGFYGTGQARRRLDFGEDITVL